MKLKPIYIYSILFCVVLITLISLSNSENDTKTEAAVDSKQMPKDEIHESFQNNSSNPSGANVTSEIKTKLDELEKYVASNPNDTAKTREYADMLVSAHNADKAIELFDNILKKDNNRVDILSKLSILYYNKNDFLKADQYIERILALDPSNTEAQYNLGVVKVRIGDIQAAQKQWEDLLANHPNTKMSDMAKKSLERLSSK